MRRTAAIIRSRTARVYRLSAVGFDAATGEVFYWAWLGTSFEAATWRQRLTADEVAAARTAGRIVDGITQDEAARMTAATRPLVAVDRTPVPRTARPYVERSAGQSLHAALGKHVGDHYAFASDVLGYAVRSFGGLLPRERAAVRRALDLVTALPA